MSQGQFELFGTQYNVQLSSYVNGGTAIQLIDAEEGFPMGTATVYVDGVKLPSERHVITKNYSENEGILEALAAANIVKRTGEMIRTGFVMSPVAKILLDA